MNEREVAIEALDELARWALARATVALDSNAGRAEVEQLTAKIRTVIDPSASHPGMRIGDSRQTPHWTKSPPQTSGWYWIRNANGEKRVTRVGNEYRRHIPIGQSDELPGLEWWSESLDPPT